MMRRLLSVANLAALAVTVMVFYVSLLLWDTNLGVVVAALIAGVAGAATWFVLRRRADGPGLASALGDIPCLGAVPIDDAGPAPTLTEAEISDRFTGILREVEGRTTGQVLLVSSPGPGQGASRVALNLSIAASRAGRRVMLIDADSSPGGLGRFLSSGRSPGLTDVATGTATLADATRMWTLEDGATFPMLPSGAGDADSADLAGVLLADALDTVSEHADLIVIDVPPVMWSSATPDLGAHADGTVLVLTDGADPETVSTARSQLEAAGAPVVGYVRNRSTGTSLVPHRVRSAVIGGAAAAAVLLVAYSAYTGVQLWNTWNQVEKDALDVEAVVAMQDSDEPRETADPEDDVVLEDDEPAPATPPTTTPTEAYETLLVIGSDEIAGAADVILYLVRPTNGADPFMVSLPRDLYVDNPCTGGNSRINALIKGCASQDINGPSLLSYQVGVITGIEVDHFAMFDFDGFEAIVDSIGGVEICLEYPVRGREGGARPTRRVHPGDRGPGALVGAKPEDAAARERVVVHGSGRLGPPTEPTPAGRPAPTVREDEDVRLADGAHDEGAEPRRQLRPGQWPVDQQGRQSRLGAPGPRHRFHQAARDPGAPHPFEVGSVHPRRNSDIRRSPLRGLRRRSPDGGRCGRDRRGEPLTRTMRRTPNQEPR